MSGRYGRSLARIHHEAFGAYADESAAGILAALDEGCEVLELGAGSGALTRHLVAAGHQLRATDASPDMVELLKSAVPEAEAGVLKLGVDPIPPARTIVSAGHVLSYLDSEAQLFAVLRECASALEPGGLLLVDLLDRSYGESRSDLAAIHVEGDGWEMDVAFELPAPDRFVRDISMRMETEDGGVVEDHERHVNVLVDATRALEVLLEAGLDAELRSAFGDELLPPGFVVLEARRPS